MVSPRAATSTLWQATCRIAPRPALDEDTSSDVCVIGAGIAGMTTAYLLAVQGNRVVVVDDGSIGGGMTSHTTAPPQLTPYSVSPGPGLLASS